MRTCSRRISTSARASGRCARLAERFNRLTREYGNKAAALSRISLRLLRKVWDPDHPEPVLVVSSPQAMAERTRTGRTSGIVRMGGPRGSVAAPSVAGFPLAFERERGNREALVRAGVELDAGIGEQQLAAAPQRDRIESEHPGSLAAGLALWLPRRFPGKSGGRSAGHCRTFGNFLPAWWSQAAGRLP